MVTLTTKVKTIIISVAVVGSVAILGFSIADRDDVEDYFVEKITSEETFTIEEWQAYAAFLDHEIKASGGVKLKDIRNKKDLKDRLNSLLD